LTQATTGRLPTPVLVVDVNVFIAAAIRGTGSTIDLLRAVESGAIKLVLSPLLLAELRGVLRRPRFRRWLSLAEVEEFVDAIELVAEIVEDPPSEGLAPVTRDPKDDYLVFLAEEVHATFLVSRDRDLLECKRPGLAIRTPEDALEQLQYQHAWGTGLLRGGWEEVLPQIEAEGHSAVFMAAIAFLQVLQEPNAAELLPLVVTPESRHAWLRQLRKVAADLAERGITSRPEYPSPDVAFVKLPPDPGDNLRAVGPVPLPADTKILTLQRRPELDGLPGLGGWRVHALTDGVPTSEDVAQLYQPRAGS
jgi:putative PIN family toxin of toxin-antitoxin system